MSFAGGLGQYTFQRMMEKTRPLREGTDEKMLISRKSWLSFFAKNTVEVLCTSLYVDLAHEKLCLPPKKMYEEKWKYWSWFYTELYRLSFVTIHFLYVLSSFSEFFPGKKLKSLKKISPRYCSTVFPPKMSILRTKRKLAGVARDSNAGPYRNSQSQKSTILRKKEEYNTQVEEEIDDTATMKVFQELSRTESQILGALH